MSPRKGQAEPSGRGPDGRRRRRAWDVPAILVLSGIAANALVSNTVDETLGTWVGAALAFAGTVTFFVTQRAGLRGGSVGEEEPGRGEPPRDEQHGDRDEGPGRD